MKKLTVLLIALFIAVAGASAQKGEKSIGMNLGYGTEIERLGLGARFQYGLTDMIRIAPDLTYFFSNNGVDLWDININFHFLFPVEKVKLYPLTGFIISTVNGKHDSESRLGVNIGGGIQCDLTPELMFNGELKYGIVKDFDQAVISMGIAYRF